MNWKVIKDSIRGILRVKYFYYSALFILANLFFTSEITTSVGTPHKNMILVVEVVLECSLLSLLYYVKKKKCTIEKVFLTIAIPLGFCFALFMPLGQVPDEPAHIWRSYGVSDGVLVVPIDEEGRAGSYLPKNINEFSWWNPSAGALRKTFTNLDDPVSEETKFVDYIMTANYNPLCYAPQVIAILVSKLFRFPLAVMLIFARLMNLAFFIAIIYYALKIVPKFKSFVLFFSLLPITLQQAASFSPDALLISTCTLMIAFVLNLIFVKRGRMNKWEIALLYVLAIIVGLSKAAYSPLILSYFLIPKERFGSGKKKFLHAIGIGLFVLLDFIWIIYSSRYFTVLSSDVVPDQQKAFLIEHPYSSALIFIRSIATNMQFYLSSMLGNNLGTLQISMPVFFTTIFHLR